MNKCRTCGRAIGEWKFCQFCGTPLDVTDLSYQNTGTLLRHNVVFSEDVPPQRETATASPQNNTSGQPITTDIYSSFEAKKTQNETVPANQKNLRKDTITKKEPVNETCAPIPAVSVESTETPDPQPIVIANQAVENNTPNTENDLQTAAKVQEPETPLNIGNLFGFANQAHFEHEEDKLTEPHPQEETLESSSNNYLIMPASDDFSQIDFDSIDTDDFTDDQIETNSKEDDSQFNALSLYESAELIEPEESFFKPTEQITQDEPVFEPTEQIAQDEPVSEPAEPIAQEEPVSEPAEPIAQEEPVFKPAEPVAQEEPVFKPTEPIVQEKPTFEPVEQTVPTTEPATPVSEIDPMFGAAPSFDIESIKASFDAKKAGSKKKPKKGLFNRKK